MPNNNTKTAAPRKAHDDVDRQPDAVKGGRISHPGPGLKEGRRQNQEDHRNHEQPQMGHLQPQLRYAVGQDHRPPEHHQEVEHLCDRNRPQVREPRNQGGGMSGESDDHANRRHPENPAPAIEKIVDVPHCAGEVSHQGQRDKKRLDDERRVHPESSSPAGSIPSVLCSNSTLYDAGRIARTFGRGAPSPLIASRRSDRPPWGAACGGERPSGGYAKLS